MSQPGLSNDIVLKIKTALEALDQEDAGLDGQKLKPSQCYRFELDPVHVLFNTNCPDSLKHKVQAILSKHVPPDLPDQKVPE